MPANSSNLSCFWQLRIGPVAGCSGLVHTVVPACLPSEVFLLQGVWHMPGSSAYCQVAGLFAMVSLTVSHADGSLAKAPAAVGQHTVPNGPPPPVLRSLRTLQVGTALQHSVSSVPLYSAHMVHHYLWAYVSM